MSNAKRFIGVILAMIMVLSTLVVGVSAYAPYKDSGIKESQYDDVMKPVLTTQQYASSAVDELDRMLAKENLKMTSDELYGLGSLDLTSVDATLKSVYDFVNGQSFSALSGLLGDLKNLSANSFNGVSRSTKTDLDVLYSVLGFLYENKDIFVDFVDGTIDLGSILPAALGDDLDEYSDVSKLLKSMLYEEVYTVKYYVEKEDGTQEKKKDKPNMDSDEHQAALAKSTFDGLVQELIDKSVLKEDKYPELTGHTNISTGTMYSFIDEALKALFNGYLLEELNGSIKNEIKKLCGVEFKKNDSGSYIKDDDGNKIEDNRNNLNSYANFLNIDYEYKGFTFGTGSFMSQLNNILGSFVKVVVKDASLVKWTDGDNSVLLDNLVGLAKTVLLDFGSEFFADYIKLADKATIEAMNDEQLIVYALRAIINSSVKGMYIPDDVVTVIDFGYYTLSQLLATSIPELDFSSYEKNLDTLIVMAIDYAIHNLNATADMGGLTYAYSMDDVDAQMKKLAVFAIDTYGGLLNGIKLSKTDSGWVTVNKILDGVIGLDWLPKSANKDIKTFLIDNLLTDIANLDFEKILKEFEASSFPTTSDLNKTPKQAVINLVVKIFNAIFPGAFSPATSFDALFTNASLAKLIDALFSDLYNYRVNLMQAGLPLACSILELTDEQEFKFPRVTCDTYIYDASGAPSFDITFRNSSTGINTAYYDKDGKFHQDLLYKYKIKSITSNISTVTLTPSTDEVQSSEECTIKVSGTVSANTPFIVTVTYDVYTEDGETTLTSSPLTEYIYSYISVNAQNNLGAERSATSGDYKILTDDNIYATSIGELTDAEVKVYNNSSTDITATAYTTGKVLINSDYIVANDEVITVLGGTKGYTATEFFKTTDTYKDLSNEEKDAAWDAICSTGTAKSIPGRYTYTLGATIGSTTVKHAKTSYIFCFKDYDLDSLISKEVNKHRQKSNYSDEAAWEAWESAMENAVKVAYSPRIATNFASKNQTMSQYQPAAEKLTAAIKALDATVIGGGLDETKAILASYSTSNEEKNYTDADYSFFSVDDFVPYTYYNYRDEARAAQSMIENAEAINKTTGEPNGVDALTAIYRNHRLSLYGGRLLRKTAVKTQLAKAIKAADAKNYVSSNYEAHSWEKYQEAYNFAVSVNNNASTTLEQSRVNTAYEMLLEYQKRLISAGSGSSTGSAEYTLISDVQVVETADGKVLAGVLGGGTFDTSYYFSTLKNCTVELVANDVGTYSTGAKVIVKDSSGNALETYIVSVFDDVNGDGQTDANDTFTITCCATGVSTFDSQYLVLAADMNADGSIDGNDITGSSAISTGSAIVDFVNREVVYQ